MSAHMAVSGQLTAPPHMYKMRTGHSRGGGDIVADSTPTGGEAATAAPGATATNQNPDKQ